MNFVYNKLADGTANESYQRMPLTLTKKIVNFFKPGVHCVKRCGFYQGNYSILKKEEMITSGYYPGSKKNNSEISSITEYNKLFGIKNEEVNEEENTCNGLPWLAFEGTYSECKDFIDQNKTYAHIDRH